jgi:anti-sigma factor RsiW
MNHLTDLELRNAARERIVAHLAECAECARRYADAIRNRPLEAEPATDVGDFAATGRRFARRRNPWIAPLAAAAVLVIVIAIPLLRR